MRPRLVPGGLVTLLAVATAVAVCPTPATAAVPRAGMVNIADQFDRPSSGSTQIATIGGTWSSAATAWTRSGGTAHLTAAAGTSAAAWLPVVAANEEYSAAFTITDPPTSGRGYFGTILRQQSDPTSGYATRIKWEAGRKTLQITDPAGTPIAASDPTAAGDLVDDIVADHAYTLTSRVTGSGPVTVSTVLADMDSGAVIGRLSATTTGTPADLAQGTFGVYDRGQATTSPASPASAVGMDVHRVLGTGTAIGTGTATPNATNTGVISSQLTDYTGPNPVVASQTGKRFTSQVIIGADNVTISDSLIASGKVARGDEGMVQNRKGFKNVVVRDVTFAPSDFDVNTYGFFGSNTTLINVDMSNVVDGINPVAPSANAGADVSVYNSYIHGLAWYKVDVRQGGRPSHNDVVQTVGAPHLVVAGNTLDGMRPGEHSESNYSPGSVWQTSQTFAPGGVTRDQVFNHNSVAGGGCSINLSGLTKSNPEPPNFSTPVTGITITFNEFAQGTQSAGCYIIAPRTANPSGTSGTAWARVTGAYFSDEPDAAYMSLNPLRNRTAAGDLVLLSKGD